MPFQPNCMFFALSFSLSFSPSATNFFSPLWADVNDDDEYKGGALQSTKFVCMRVCVYVPYRCSSGIKNSSTNKCCFCTLCSFINLQQNCHNEKQKTILSRYIYTSTKNVRNLTMTVCHSVSVYVCVGVVVMLAGEVTLNKSERLKVGNISWHPHIYFAVCVGVFAKYMCVSSCRFAFV